MAYRHDGGGAVGFDLVADSKTPSAVANRPSLEEWARFLPERQYQQGFDQVLPTPR